MRIQSTNYDNRENESNKSITPTDNEAISLHNKDTLHCSHYQEGWKINNDSCPPFVDTDLLENYLKGEGLMTKCKNKTCYILCPCRSCEDLGEGLEADHVIIGKELRLQETIIKMEKLQEDNQSCPSKLNSDNFKKPVLEPSCLKIRDNFHQVDSLNDKKNTKNVPSQGQGGPQSF